ncbi:putative E3 SUMO-protein ligase RNF212 isoform X2 [Lissotriton helveticus]
MNGAVRCNICFTHATSRTISSFALTNCGHVLCEACLRKGKKEECTVCRTRCRIICLSGQLSPDVKCFFMDVNLLCKKYSKEFAQVSDFQESHRRRCLAFYKEKIAKLEEMNKKLSQHLEQLQSPRSPQELSRVQSSTSINSSSSSHLTKQYGYSSCLHPLTHQLSSNVISAPPPSRLAPSSTANSSSGHSANFNGFSKYSLPLSRPVSLDVDNSMEVDVSSQFRKPESMPGPNRLSLISPPQDGRMGCVSHRISHATGLGASQNSYSGSARSSPGRFQQPANGFSNISLAGSQTNLNRLSDYACTRAPPSFLPTTSSFQAPSSRHQITIPSLLQRQHLGKLP